MRKYKQVFGTIFGVICFAALVYYKHEYDRLRYTLEYLDTFGEPKANNEESRCHFMPIIRHLTPLAEWTVVSDGVFVYSSFWDMGLNMFESRLKTIAVIENTGKIPSELSVKLWYSSSLSLLARCEMEHIEQNSNLKIKNDVHIVHLVCKPMIMGNNVQLKMHIPTVVQFSSGGDKWTSLKQIHYSGNYKYVDNRGVVCVMPSLQFPNSIDNVELISHYTLLGFHKFVFYGVFLTENVRKLVSRYEDELGIIVEEKSFNYVPVLQSAGGGNSSTENVKRRIIELDCQHRHHNTFEFVTVINQDQFIIPGRSNVNFIKNMNDYISKSKLNLAPKFSIKSHSVCIDDEHEVVKSKHSLNHQFLLEKRIHKLEDIDTNEVVLMRPNMMPPNAASQLPMENVPISAAVVYK